MSQFLGVANAPCSWGVLDYETDGENPDFQTVLDEIAEAEYMGTELGDTGYMPRDVDELRAALFDRDLQLVASFNSVNLSSPELGFIGDQKVFENAKLLAEVGGPNSVILISDSPCADPLRTELAGRIQPEQTLSHERWEFAAQTANQIATQVMDSTGLRTAYHPHCATFVETPQEVEFMMEVTHPHVLGLCLDTGHYAYGGGDPLVLVHRYGERIWHAHYKGYNANLGAEARIREMDYSQAIDHGVFSELQDSHVDYRAITEALEDYSYDGWIVVEQDVNPGQGHPLESAKRNRNFLKGLGL
jgi:inosose dehydratase